MRISLAAFLPARDFGKNPQEHGHDCHPAGHDEETSHVSPSG
jgi:hypothetical protein